MTYGGTKKRFTAINYPISTNNLNNKSMAKVVVDIHDEYAMLELKKLALKNDLKTNKPELINLAIDIAKSTMRLNSEVFEKVTQLKK